MSDDLLTRLRNHIAQMAPHQKERAGGKLLLEAAEEIERLRKLTSPVTDNPQEDEFYKRAENPRSKCCGAAMRIVWGAEGTFWYACTKCGQGCDAV